MSPNSAGPYFILLHIHPSSTPFLSQHLQSSECRMQLWVNLPRCLRCILPLVQFISCFSFLYYHIIWAYWTGVIGKKATQLSKAMPPVYFALYTGGRDGMFWLCYYSRLTVSFTLLLTTMGSTGRGQQPHFCKADLFL